MNQLNVCILFGGISPEHAVSLRSAESVLTHIDKTRYHVLPVGITQEGRWFLFGGSDYSELPSGAWLKNGEYGVIHRVASDGTAKGVFSALFEFARGRVSDLRIDTHADNRVMQAVLLRHGFVKRGVAVVRGGGERLAFEYNGKK